MNKTKLEALYVRFVELKQLVGLLCDNAITAEEKTMALHTIEDVLELIVNEFEPLLYAEK